MTTAITEAAPPIITTGPDSSSSRRRVLLISYQFPPVGGAGVQRPAKFAKYLGRFGWDVTVLMAANPSVPVMDESLCSDIPPEVNIVTARTHEPGYQLKKNLAASAAKSATGPLARLRSAMRRGVRSVAGMLLQPDPQVLWLPDASRVARRLLSETPHDAILATAPPYSNLLLGAGLSRRFGLPLVSDFRDEWDLSSLYLENSQKDHFSRFVQSQMQRMVFRHSDALVATTRASADHLRRRAAECGNSAESFCIYNGFDADDFPAADDRGSAHRPKDSQRVRFVYTGTLWNLTDVSPLVAAVEQVARTNRGLLDRAEFVFVGRRTSEQQAHIQRLQEIGVPVELHDYCEHSTALQQMASADVLCLLLSDVAGAGRVVPAKMFEYLASRREILAIVPPGETADLMGQFPSASCHTPRDTAGLASWISDRLQRGHSVDPTAENDQLSQQIERFSRESLCGQLADVLDHVVNLKHGEGR